MKALFSKMKLSHRIIAPNLVFILVLGLAIYMAIHSGTMIRSASDHQTQLTDLQQKFRTSVLALQNFVSHEISYEELKSKEEDLFKNMGRIKGLAPIVSKVGNDLAQYEKFNQKNHELEKEILQLSGYAIQQSDQYINETVKRLANENQRASVTTLERLVIGGAYVNTTSNYQTQLFLQKVKQDIKQKDQAFAYLDTILVNVDKDIKRLAGTPFAGLPKNAKTAIIKIRHDFQKLVGNLEKQYGLKEAVYKDMNSAVALLDKISREENSDLLSQFKSYFRIVAVILTAAVLFTICLNVFIAGRVNRTLVTAITGIDLVAEQVRDATTQVSSASQTLAVGASEQAASLEETAASLEEITTMTRQNGKNAKHADDLMSTAGQIVVESNKAMGELTNSMDEIAKSSEETSKIIKTIDEIAFQTNLLALNAAVEAARAGEAGAGFAVVADEVRNLAMRAADAARDTTALIEDTARKVSEGAEAVKFTDDSFSKVSESAEQVGSLVSEIAAASDEQTQGIEQINIAVASMDQVVQQNASSSEETASATQEMAAQAEQMKHMLKDLTTLTGTADKALKIVDITSESLSGNETITQKRTANALPAGEKNKTGVSARKSSEVRPDQTIAFDEDLAFESF